MPACRLPALAAALLLAAAALTLPACRAASDAPTQAESSTGGASDLFSSPASPPSDAAAPATPLTEASLRAADTSARPAVPRMLVRTGTMRVRVRDLSAARRAAIGAAERRGGYVGNESETNAAYGSSATLTLRVPAERYAALVDTLTALGTVEERSSEIEDVTRAFADLDARTKTRLATEQRFRELLARAQNVEEVMAVERQLSDIRGEIESAQAQLRTMRDQAALSTLTLTLATAEAQAGPTFLSRLGDALRDGGALLVSFVLALVRLWGLLLVAALVVVLWRRWIGPRWHARRAARHMPPPVPPAETTA